MEEEKKEGELAKVEEAKQLKPGVLRDDLFEDLIHREYVSRQRADEDLSLRVTPTYDEEADVGKIISTGRKEAKEALDKVLRAKRIEHEAVTPKAYPGEEGYDAEKVRKIAEPRFERTLKALKEIKSLPKPPWEDWFLEGPGSEKEKTAEELSGFIEQSPFTPKFKEEGGEKHGS